MLYVVLLSLLPNEFAHRDNEAVLCCAELYCMLNKTH